MGVGYSTRFFLIVMVLVFSGGLVESVRGHDDEAGPTRWYRGNLHTHSLWSDGNDFPEMIVDWYARNGYDFLTLSDHNILSKGEKWIPEEQGPKRGAIGGLKRYRERFGDQWVETREKDGKTEIRLKTLTEFRPMFEKPDKFLLIQAEEITDHFKSHPVHINASNLAEFIRPRGGESIRETIANNLIAVEQQRQRVGRPMLAHLNHPNFGYAVSAEDMAAVIQEKFFEVYNGHPSVHHQGDKTYIGMERMWDIANTIRVAEMKRPPLYGLATDDSHNYFGNRGASPGRGWVMVRAGKLTAEALIHALEDGAFYSSSGVGLKQITFDTKTRTLSLEIDGEEGVTYATEFVGTPVDYDKRTTPVLDKDGKPIAARRKYSADVGKVFKTVKGMKPSYQLSGQELYVRAVVTSTKKHPNPSFDGQTEQAWTQPIGWQTRIKKSDK